MRIAGEIPHRDKHMNKYIKELEDMAGKKEWRDGFHQGIDGDNLCVELEIGRLLMDLVKVSKPKTIVEFGTASGYSTSWMYIGNPKAVIYTVDEVKREPYVWNRIGIKDSKIITINKSCESVDKKDLPKSIDFAFLDSNHRIEKVEKDLDLIMPLVSSKGIVTVHDTNYCRGMGDLLAKRFEATVGWEYEEIRLSCGLGIARKYI